MKKRIAAALAAVLCLLMAGCGKEASSAGTAAGSSAETAGTTAETAGAAKTTEESAAETAGSAESALTLTASGTEREYGNDETPFSDALFKTLKSRRFSAEYEMLLLGEVIGRTVLEVNGDNVHLKTEPVPSKVDDQLLTKVSDSECVFIGADSYTEKDGVWKKEAWRSPYFSAADPTASALTSVLFYTASFDPSALTLRSRETASDGTVTESFVRNKSDVLAITYDADGKLLSTENGVNGQRFTKFTEEVGEITAPEITEQTEKGGA